MLTHIGYQVFVCSFSFLFVCFGLLSSLASSFPRRCLLPCTVGWTWPPIAYKFMAPVRRATRLSLEPLSPNLQYRGKGPIAPDWGKCLIWFSLHHVNWCWGRQVLRKVGGHSTTCSPQTTILRNAFICEIQVHEVYRNFLCSLVAFYSLPKSISISSSIYQNFCC